MSYTSYNSRQAIVVTKAPIFSHITPIVKLLHGMDEINVGGYLAVDSVCWEIGDKSKSWIKPYWTSWINPGSLVVCLTIWSCLIARLYFTSSSTSTVDQLLTVRNQYILFSELQHQELALGSLCVIFQAQIHSEYHFHIPLCSRTLCIKHLSR